MPFPLILIPLGIGAVALVNAIFSGDSSSSSSSSREEGEFSGDYPSGSDAYAGRWTQNEIAIKHNIDMGMAIKED